MIDSATNQTEPDLQVSAFHTFATSIYSFANVTGKMVEADNNEITNALLHALALQLGKQRPEGIDSSLEEFKGALDKLTRHYHQTFAASQRSINVQ
jgi:hypothetical protein